LAALRNCRIKASEEEIALALQGHWRREHLFALKQALEAFDFCGQQLAELDAQIEAQLQRLQVTEDEPAKGRKRSVARNAPKFDLRARLFSMCGVDLTAIPGVDVTTALAVVSQDRCRPHGLPHGQALRQLARPCPRDQDQWGQEAQRPHAAKFQPRGPGLAAGRSGAAHQPVCAGGLLPETLCAHGQTEGGDSGSPQAGAADLRDVDPRPAVHRPGAGALRGAISRPSGGQPHPAGAAVGLQLVPLAGASPQTATA
jgi:hypothetical protein